MSERVSPWEGVAGHVMRSSISLASWATGLAVAATSLLIVFIFGRFDEQALASILIQALLALVLARFALNGLAGEWDGTLFSTAGGSWRDATAVAIRYFTISALWLVPLLILQIDSGRLSPFGRSGMAGLSRPMALLAGITLGIAAFGPPIFLAVAVACESFGDLFRPETWTSLLRNRSGDVAVLYVTYTGALGMAALLTLGIAAIAALIEPKLLWGVALVFGPLLLGMVFTLLGRLSGFFVLTGIDPEASTFQFAGGSSASVVSLVPSGPERHSGGAVPPADAQVAAGSPMASTARDGPPQVPRTAAEPLPAERAPSPPQSLDDVPEGGPPRRPPLLDARQRVEKALAGLAEEPERVIRILQQLRNDYAPAPAVLHALCVALVGIGRREEAMEVAVEAVPLCLERGNIRLAADIYRRLLLRVSELGLSRDQTIAVGNALREMSDLRAAAFTYASVLKSDPQETRAVKGLLQVGQGQLQQKGDPREALKIFNYLLEQCGDSPLSEFMREGREEAERKIAAL